MADNQPDPPAKTEDSGSQSKAHQLSLIEISFPAKITPFVWLAMIMGLILIVGALTDHIWKWQFQATGSLLLSAGIAIILAAFGGQATVRGKIYALAGVAALAFLLTGFLEYRRRRRPQLSVCIPGWLAALG